MEQKHARAEKHKVFLQRMGKYIVGGEKCCLGGNRGSICSSGLAEARLPDTNIILLMFVALCFSFHFSADIYWVPSIKVSGPKGNT